MIPERGDSLGPAGANPSPGDSPAGAVNRSRPIYGETGSNRGGGPWNRRNGSGANDPSRRDGRGGASGRPDGRRGGPAGSFDPRLTRGLVQRQRVEEAGTPALPTNPREAALRILHAVDTRSAFSDRLLDGAHQRGGPDPRDHALLHELVKGTLRWRGRIDWVLDRLIHIGLEQVQPWIKNVLRLGAYQVLFLDRIPAHAAVDEAVKLAHQYGHPGTAGLANSVLRRLIEEKDKLQLPEGDDAESLSIWGSHPRWIVDRWLARFGPDATRALLTADNRIVPVGLRVHRLKLTRDELVEQLARDGVTAHAAEHSPDIVWAENASAPGSLDAFKRGMCTAQDESEALVSRLVAPEPHERLLDLCAAPGGKCTHLAELMGDEGEVWAMERAQPRVESLEQAIARLGLHCIHVQLGDGRTYNFPMPFDRVLVDAPCSGLGVLARRADARWRKGPEVLAEMPGIQMELLVAGGARLRPGGVLVYSVCSFEPEETTQIVERFLRQNPAFIAESAGAFLPEAVVNADGFMEVLPHVHGCDGAFAARFRRI
ncbi:MAG: 16S rRNA (cytosine(967)-C(5))-methyltransferase RsmB [Candidatus Eisenbacteria bacterium]